MMMFHGLGQNPSSLLHSHCLLILALLLGTKSAGSLPVSGPGPGEVRLTAGHAQGTDNFKKSYDQNEGVEALGVHVPTNNVPHSM